MKSTITQAQRPDGSAVVSFFETPVERLCDELCTWRRNVGYTCDVRRPRDQCWNWQRFLSPYCTPPHSGVLVPTVNMWSAFLDNDRIGNIPYGDLISVSERLRVRSVSFVLDDSKKAKDDGRPHGVMFYYCDATTGVAVTHSVAVIRDNGHWEYDAQGAALPFEDISAYRAPKKANRLTNELLIRYAHALAIQIEDEAYYDIEGAIGIVWTLAQSVDIEERKKEDAARMGDGSNGRTARSERTSVTRVFPGFAGSRAGLDIRVQRLITHEVSLAGTLAAFRAASSFGARCQQEIQRFP